jgi:hypothetical protein
MAEAAPENDPVQIFAEGSFVEGTLTWGWQCFRCRAEESGFGSATTAARWGDHHGALGCPIPFETSAADD